MKTIKQIAEELGISKQKIYRVIVENQIKHSGKASHNRYMYDEASVGLIYRAVCDNIDTKESSSENQEQNSTDSEIEFLKKLVNELRAQNTALQAELVEAIKTMGTLASQAQHLQAQSQKALTDGKEKRRRWWQRKSE